MIHQEDVIKVRDGSALAGEAEAMRMMLWWLLMQRGQGHLAHAVLAAGFELIEELRRMGFGLWTCDEHQWYWFTVKARYWCQTLVECNSHFKASNASERTIARVARCEALFTAASKEWPSGRQKADQKARERARKEACETEPQKNAPLTGAKTESAPPCPVADSVGNGQPTKSEPTSPSSTASGEREAGLPTTPPRNRSASSGVRRGKKSRGGPYKDSVGGRVEEAIRRGDAEVKAPVGPLQRPVDEREVTP